MNRSTWFLALGFGLLGTVLNAAPPTHGHMPGPRPGMMPRPVAHPGGMPQIHPGSLPQIHPGALPGQFMPKPQLSLIGPKPLLTNPHPTATPKPAVTKTTTQQTLASPQSIAAANAAALSAAVMAGKDPASVALYLASQNNWGRGNWGGWGWGWGGYAPFGFYGFSPFGFFPWGFGPGFGIGFGYNAGPFTFGLGYNFGYSPYMPYVPVYAEPPVIVGANPPLVPQGEALPPPAIAEKPAEPAGNFAERGQDLFLSGKYDEAVKEFRHAVVDDPKNGPLLALTGEALWAAGSYNEAAGAIQQSLLATPEADWAAVSARAARLTPTEAVTKVGAALAEKERPELRFLAAYQSFGAGKYDEAGAHLDVLLKNAPNDQVAKKLREQAAKLSMGK